MTRLRILATALLFVILINTTAFAAPLAGANDDLDSYWMSYSGDTEWASETTDAADATEADVSWPPASGDKVYFGHETSKFNEIYIDISSTFAFEAAVTTFTYWDGSSWSSLGSVTNTSDAFTGTGVHDFAFTAPGDWATTSVNGEGGSYYYVRLECGDGCGNLGVDQISVTTVGGGEGAAVPEFSTYVYILTMMVAVYMITRKQKVQTAL